MPRSNDEGADLVWTTAEYLPQGRWLDLAVQRAGVSDLRSSLETTSQALQREKASLIACNSYWEGLPPPPNPVPRNFSWSTSTEDCGILPLGESAPRETQPLRPRVVTSPARAFASRRTLRGIRMRAAQEEARRTKVDAFKMAARADSRLKTTLSSCSEIHGGSEICTVPKRRGSSPSIFYSMSAASKLSVSPENAAFASDQEQTCAEAVQHTGHIHEHADPTQPVQTLLDVTQTWRKRTAEARMSSQFRAWQKWSDRNTRSISAVTPGLPKTPELARARGRRVAALAKQKVELAVERQGKGSVLWKSRTGGLKELRIVNLERNGVTDKKAQFLGEEFALVPPGRPVHVLLAENWIGEAGAAAIASGLLASNCTHRINLAQNRIGGAGAGHFGKLITLESELRSLDLSGNPLGLASFEALGEALSKSATLRILRLDRTGAGRGGALEALSGALCSADCTLKSLSLRKNAIRGVGACMLAESLAENVCLHSLELGNNSISEALLADGSAGAAIRFAAALRENSVLRTLDLAHNDIGDGGAAELASALEHNNSLRTLVFTLFNSSLHVPSHLTVTQSRDAYTGTGTV